MVSNRRARLPELVRFVFVGGISFAIDFGMLVLLQEVFGLKSVANGVLISAAVAYGVGLAVHYLLSVFWVFRGHHVKTGMDHLRAGSLFALTCGIGFLLTELGMWLGVQIFGWHYTIVKIGVTGIVMFWNYGSQKFLVFR